MVGHPVAGSFRLGLRDCAVVVGVDAGETFFHRAFAQFFGRKAAVAVVVHTLDHLGAAGGEGLGHPGQLLGREFSGIKLSVAVGIGSGELGRAFSGKLGFGHFAILVGVDAVKHLLQHGAATFGAVNAVGTAFGHCGRAKARDEHGADKCQGSEGGFRVGRHMVFSCSGSFFLTHLHSQTAGVPGSVENTCAVLRHGATGGHSLRLAPVVCRALAVCLEMSCRFRPPLRPQWNAAR